VYEQKRIETKEKECEELLQDELSGCALDNYWKSQIHLPDNYRNSSVSMKAIRDSVKTQIINTTAAYNTFISQCNAAEKHISTMNKILQLKVPLGKDNFLTGFQPEFFNLEKLMAKITEDANRQAEVERELIKTPDLKTKNVDEAKYTFSVEITCTESVFDKIKTYAESLGAEFRDNEF
nr:hypothetical protein [Candidatus Cloacimonadota bacterium]